MSRTLQLFAVLIFFTAARSPVRVQHQHEHGKPVEFKMPTTYADAVGEIKNRLHEITDLMQTKELAKVHAEADVIQKVAKVIGQLALKEGSGVPKEAVKEINLAGKELAAKFDPMDKAADSGNAAETKTVYDEMVKLADSLAKYAPIVYQCPMKCEGEKTYDKPGKCPKCGMEVQDVRAHLDHNAKHGGVFFMTSDQNHHLEGTLSVSGEFRVYFYDEYTKPISAEGFITDGNAWTQKSTLWMDGADQAKPFTMKIEPGKAYLAAQIDASVKFPVGIKATIDFKNGEKPQAFNFEFHEPSKEPSGNDH
ncbi:MAG: hypothetical protein HY287_03660 [Planctomycetes bacterium]|nr:hypothetical protein [Planctomycetota bacterium]MBI3833408.1 hypothetical protein [Planctomycetota bacterium]